MIMQDHAKKRETHVGRLFPFAFYMINFALWFVTGIIAGAWDLLWLAILPLPFLILYLLRTRKKV